MRMKMFSILAIFIYFISLNFVNAQQKFSTPKFYTGVANTGNNMILGIPEDVWDVMPENGDEIGAFNVEGKLVGTMVFTGGNCAITVWGDDETTKSDEGIARGKRFTLRLYHNQTGSEDEIVITDWLQGDDIYKVDGISVASKLNLVTYSEAGMKFELKQNIPNPATSMTKIEFFIPIATYVEFILFSTEGKIVREFYSGNLPEGNHSIELNVSELAAGNYYYKMITTEFANTKYMNVIRK